jgi:plasmid stabilization system protein ParE
MKLYVRPAFYQDIAHEELWLLEHAGATVADRWHAALGDTIVFLRKNPLMGRVRTDLKFPGIRSWRVQEFGRWIVFYGVRDDTLILYRVVSGAMNLLALRFD